MKAFQGTKKTLTEATLLNHSCHNVPISLNLDASDLEVGPVLKHFVNSTWESLAFFSKKLRPPERKCSTFTWNCSPSTWVCYFNYFLEGHQFFTHTDLKPSQLLYVQHTLVLVNSPATQALLHLWMDYRYPATSREGQLRSWHVIQSHHWWHAAGHHGHMAAAQWQDFQVQAYCTVNTSLQLEGACFELQAAKLLCDISTNHAS